MKLGIRFFLYKAILFAFFIDFDEKAIGIGFLCFGITIQKVYKSDKRLLFINNF